LRTHKARVAGGKEVEYLYLAHNVRDEATKKSVPKIVHAFGRADEVNREVLVRLCRSIARVCGLEVHDPMGEGIRAAAGRALPEGVTQVETWPLGPVLVMEALWERFGIAEELRRIERESKCTVPYERALFAMTANRLSEPTSKPGVRDRWLDKVHVPSCAGLKLAQMYEAMDLLHRHAARVEEAVSLREERRQECRVGLRRRS